MNPHEAAPHPNSAELSQEEQNQEVLRNAELGVILERAYIDAMNTDPRLADIAVVPITDPDEKKPAFAVANWTPGQNQTGKHEVHIRLDNLDETMAIYEDVMRRSPGAVEAIAETLDMPVSEMTAPLLYVQSILHEMGHTLEFMDAEAQGKTPEEHKHEVKAEAVKRPLGGLVASHLLDETSRSYQLVTDNWDQIAQQESVASLDELFDKTATAHRHLHFEHEADKFAGRVLQMQPVMVEQLTGDIEKYRDYPQL